VVVRRRAGWGYAIAWALGIGVGAVAAGAFVGYLVNGPPGHSPSHRHIADVAPPTPVAPPTAQEIAGSGSASTTSRPATTMATAAPASQAASSPTTAAGTALPPIPPAKPRAQASSSVPPSPPLSSANDIREVQGRLASLGFDPGPIDGAAGPKTAAAVTRYQQAHGLQPTGIADRDTLEELRREPGSSPPPPPPPPPRARTQAYYSSAPPPPPRYGNSNPFVDALNRLFGR
jgi:hypothetical protein